MKPDVGKVHQIVVVVIPVVSVDEVVISWGIFSLVIVVVVVEISSEQPFVVSL